jgi:hypothetical protein
MITAESSVLEPPISHAQSALGGRLPGRISLGPSAITAFAVTTILLLVFHQSSLLRYAFPAIAFFCGIFLYKWAPTSYVSFTLWLWFLTPLVRRLVDWQTSWVDPSPVLLAPPLVTLIAGLGILRSIRELGRLRRLLFLLAFVGVLFGFLVGVILNPIREVALAGINWFGPLLFGLYMATREPTERLMRCIDRTFAWAILMMGIYGIWQFLAPSGWDSYWLDTVNQQLLIPSFGTSEALKIRVFSTMNAPGPFAVTMMVGLLVVMTGRALVGIPAAIVGTVSLLLSLLRAAWLGWITGLAVLIASKNRKLLTRCLGGLAVGVVLVGLAAESPYADAVRSRLDSFSDIKSDESVQGRSKLYRDMLALLLNEPFGTGLTTSQALNGEVLDSGVILTLLNLGWLGTALYGLALIGALRCIWSSPLGIDPRRIGYRAVIVALMVQGLAGNALSGLNGFLLWMFLGLLLNERTCILPPGSYAGYSLTVKTPLCA